MSKDPFSLAVDAPATHAKKAPVPWERLVIGGLALTLGTVVFGYYMPLTEANQQLAQQRSALASAVDGNRLQMERATNELLELKREHEQMAQKVQRGDAARVASVQRDEELVAKVKAGLAPRLKQAQILVNEAPEGVQIIVDNARLFRDHQESVYPQGQKLLCEIAKTLKQSLRDESAKITVSSEHADPTIKNSFLRRLFPSTRQLTAARAAAATNALEGCGLDGKRLVAVAGGHYHPRKETPSRSSGEVRILAGAGSVTE